MNNTNQKLNMISLGCAKALVDSEILLGGLKNENFDITKDPEEADTIVVNTCGFLDIAREESIETILQAAELKKTGNLKQLVVMGCLSERYPEALAEEIPEVDRIFGSNDHKQIASFLTGKDYAKDDPLFYRSLMTPDHYAYLKIAEGCDNGCSFCSIPIMRGLQKSRGIDSIMWEAEKLADQGVKEMLVIAQDSTSYGWDLNPKVYLSDLIHSLDTLDIDWIRLHYAHPAHLSQRIIDAMADSKHVCRYLDMPIQHGADNILKSMRRGLGQDGIRDRIQRLRQAIPDIRIRTTLIVGYPGETDDEFKQMYDFIEEIEFDRLGVFTYSEEEGTLAEALDDDVHTDVKNERKAQILDLQASISAEKNDAMLGLTYKVLVDKSGDTVSVGRTEFDSPEIDNIVHIKGAVEKGQFVDVKIDSANEFELIGSPI
ncbi:MAG: 30S ribosomal protein S12 methylthiotransferase RimO [Candidatus Marinimicrobia bacterium]|nr:30S ribosomal protein S12 methylthiotransferase RimO [Candidatus Neomarinimicrobiota bacterium]MDD9887318.1 30S ribosomal protein S12 methylthiotransferase RimO [Candidatus Neomarinimicrobiota bacterium]MDD9930747.1 30S ribosomal protein S12 methylthiotransferase RimO [Candidatus Neomarinimicrobiota bacterium]